MVFHSGWKTQPAPTRGLRSTGNPAVIYSIKLPTNRIFASSAGHVVSRPSTGLSTIFADLTVPSCKLGRKDVGGDRLIRAHVLNDFSSLASVEQLKTRNRTVLFQRHVPGFVVPLTSSASLDGHVIGG